MPVTTMGPHAAVMGIHFYTGDMFPKEYQGVAFVARKGSWNRTKKFGYDIVTVKAGRTARARRSRRSPPASWTRRTTASGAGRPTSRS
jgi:glucose/arabinose dehydrogenase